MKEIGFTLSLEELLANKEALPPGPFLQVEAAAQAGYPRRIDQDNPLKPFYNHSLFGFDVQQRLISANGNAKRLSKLDSSLLVLLFRKINRVSTYAYLIKGAWGENYLDGGPGLIKGHISSLRNNMDMIGIDSSTVLKTINEVGYILDGDPLAFTEADFDKADAPVQTYKHPDFTLYTERYEAKPIDGELVRLTSMEFMCLEILSRHENRPLTYAKLENFFLTKGFDGDMPSLQEQMSHIRSKLWPTDRKRGREMLVGVVNAGYMLVNPETIKRGHKTR